MSPGAFYLFPDVSDTGMDGAAFAERLLTEAGVSVLAGSCGQCMMMGGLQRLMLVTTMINGAVSIVAALLLAGIIVFVSSLSTRRRLPPVELADGRPLPKTALQTRATWTLIVVAALTAAAAACVVYFSPQVWWDNDAVRLTVTFLLLAALWRGEPPAGPVGRSNPTTPRT